jgi:cell division protein FtsL
MRWSVVMWAALAVVVGISLFMLKYQVIALEDRLHAAHTQIEKDKSAIRVLQAEWTYLNDPGRLRRLSEQHLGFAAPSANQVATMAQLPYRSGEVPAPEGVSAPETDAAKPLPGARSAMLSPAAFEYTQSSASFLTAAAVPERPSAIAATVARLQRLLGPTWSGTNLFQEPPR